MIPLITGAIGVAVAGVAVTVVGPVVLPLVGFTPAGITAGSWAASMMSTVYTYGYGLGVLSAVQSAGALGAVGSEIIATTSAIGGVIGTAAGYAFNFFV